MSSLPPQDMFFDPTGSRSPGFQRPPSQQPQSQSSQQQPPSQTLHRQQSRHFDVYGQMPTPMYGNGSAGAAGAGDDSAARFDKLGGAAGFGNGGYGYDFGGGSQTWNPNAFSNTPTFPGFGGTGRMKNAGRGRNNLPSTWMDQSAPPPMPNMNSFGSMPPPSLGNHSLRNDSFSHDVDEDLIPTAIVIKNIPFAVKKEQLVELMTQMNLPLPYAFNYHFDNGVFRGLAFANFTSAEETAAVIEHLNHFELQGRKLRVEYKKMLPIQERERIEREKRERRGQLEEQHRPLPSAGLQTQQSMSSMSSHIPATSPSPVSARNKLDVDLNDPQTLQFYSQLLLFKDDHSREALIFPSTLTPHQRRMVHTLAHHMQLSHISRGSGEQRQVHVVRTAPGSSVSPPLPQGPLSNNDPARRALNRAATTEFNEGRGSDPNIYGTLRGQSSTGFLGLPDSPSALSAQNNLRGAKSFADLRSYTPSPVPSSASFPAALQSNIARFQDASAASGSITSNTPTLTPTASGNTLGPSSREESLLATGLGGLSIGSSIAPQNGANSPRRLRGAFSWDDQTSLPTGPIGSHRHLSLANLDETSNQTSRDRATQNLPLRQPRGPAVERGPGFARGRQTNGHQPRGSDELRQPSSGVEIIVE